MNVLETNDLCFAYGNTPVLDRVSFSLDEGGFAALVGVNGAGKSTLLRLLLGELRPTSGSISLMGQELTHFKGWQHIGYVPQEGLTRKAAFPASVNEVVLANLYRFIGRFRMPRRAHYAAVEQTLAQVGMQEYGNRLLSELSGGQRQRVQLAQALVCRPDLLLLDEPTAGLDAQSSEEFYALLKKLNREQGLSVLLVSHDLQEIPKLTDTIFRLSHRQITRQTAKEMNPYV